MRDFFKLAAAITLLAASSACFAATAAEGASDQKAILITGASSGIGAAIAIELADAGWGVMAAGRDEGRLEEVADVSDSIATWAGDLDDAETCDELVAEAIDEFGQIDCLVDSAGILLRGNAAETSDDEWQTLRLPFDA